MGRFKASIALCRVPGTGPVEPPADATAVLSATESSRPVAVFLVCRLSRRNDSGNPVFSALANARS